MANSIRSAAPSSGVAINYAGGDQSLSQWSKKIYVSTTGHLAVVMGDGTALTFSNLPVGWHEIAVKTIKQTGSTAAGVVVF